MIALLKPLFQGEWESYGTTLLCEQKPPANAVSIAELITQPFYLKKILQQYAENLQTSDLRPTASVWITHYIGALLPPVMAASTLLNHEFPIALDEIFLTMDKNGTPERFYVSHEGKPFPDNADTEQRYHRLLHQNFQPLIQQLHYYARVPEKILWGNVARDLEGLFNEAEEQMRNTPLAERIAHDRHVLLKCPKKKDKSKNLLFMYQRDVSVIEDGQPIAITLHRQCCLYYLLPNDGYCVACPLAPQYIKPKLNDVRKSL